jgi:hypothetical protein
MYYNPIEQEVWKMRIVVAERKAMLAYQTRDLKSPEAQMLERLLCNVRRLFTARLRPNFRLMRYAAQEK